MEGRPRLIRCSRGVVVVTLGEGVNEMGFAPAVAPSASGNSESSSNQVAYQDAQSSSVPSVIRYTRVVGLGRLFEQCRHPLLDRCGRH
jgi:hypothetical protein